MGQPRQSPLLAALTVDYRGSRFVLGRTSDSYAIWDASAGGSAVQTFPLSEEGWARAWQTFRAWEPGGVAPVTAPAAVPGPSPTSSWVKDRPLAMAPMRAGQIVDGVFRLYRMHYRTLIRLVALIVVPVQAIVLLLDLATLELVATPGLPGGTSQQPAAWVTVASAAVNILFVAPFLTAAVVKTAADAYLGHRPTVGASYRVALPRVHSILWIIFLSGLAGVVFLVPGYVVLFAGVGSAPGDAVLGLAVVLILLGFVPAVFMYLRFSFGASIAVVEDVRGSAALLRSWRLVHGLTWKVLGVTILAGLIMVALFLVIGVLFLIISIPFLEDATLTGGPGAGFYTVSAVINAAAAVLVTPVFTLVFVLLYFDARIRKEGFDLAILAEQLGGRSPAKPATARPGG